MKLNKRVAIITEENIRRLSRLYGEMDIDYLSRIVNNHIKVAIDEIEEDSIQKECGSSDIIQMRADIVLTDKEGKVIDVKVPEPEYMCEIFDALKNKRRTTDMNFCKTNRKIIKNELEKLGKSNNERKNDFSISLICGLKRRKTRATIKEHLKNLFKKEN